MKDKYKLVAGCLENRERWKEMADTKDSDEDVDGGDNKHTDGGDHKHTDGGDHKQKDEDDHSDEKLTRTK